MYSRYNPPFYKERGFYLKRELCGRCERPVSVCLCEGLECHLAPVDMVLLQTASERKHPLNTGRIVKLGLDGCRVIVGEDFSKNQELNELLDKAWERTWLLYPGEQSISPKALLAESSQHNRLLKPVVIVLDATWRKSRKMLHLCPRLQALSRIGLPESSVSRYRIRKVPGEGFISTVEATVTLLAEVGHLPESCQQMLDAFERMVQRQITAIGEETWKANY